MLIFNPGGGVLPMWWVIHMCRGFDPLFSLWQDRARSFWGVFSHPPTQKRSFGYKSSQNSIFLAPKYHFSLDLFGSNFQWPAAHTQQFSDRVPPWVCGQLLTRKTEISVCGIGVLSAGFVCEGSIKANFHRYRHYLKSRFGNIVY